MLDALDDGQALFFRSLSDRVGATDDAALAAAVWDLVWAGHLTNDTLAPLRALLGGGGAHRAQAAPRRAPATGGPGRPAHAQPRARPADDGRPLVPAARARPRPDPAGRRAGRRCCSNGTAWSPAAR